MATKAKDAPATGAITEKGKARNATVSANAARVIDFSAGKAASELAVEAAATRGMWVNKLAALRAGVEEGAGESGTFYLLGEFTTASGARTVVKNLSKNPDALPGVFDMQSRIVVDANSVKTSELWVAYISDDEAAE
jgi:hypothetical protein